MLASAQAAEVELRLSHDLFESFMNHCPAVAYMKDEDNEGRYVYFNALWEKVFQRRAADCIGKADYELWSPEEARQFRENDAKALASGSVLEAVETIHHPDGDHYWMAFKFPFYGTAGRRFLAGFSVDVTEQRRLSERLRRSEEMERMGLLAAGLAHDFNNLLTTILGNISLTLSQNDLPERGRTQLREALVASERAANLVALLLASSGKGRFFVETLDLTGVLSEVCRTAEFPDWIGLTLDLAGGIPKIRADRGQLALTVRNLLANAAEAIGSGPGSVRIGTGLESFETGSECACGEPLPAGQYVYVEVEDSGAGIQAEDQRKIFDPFFSTKFAGRGLGLAAVHGVVRSHGGGIHLRSAPGKGSMFRVYFPVFSDLPP